MGKLKALLLVGIVAVAGASAAHAADLPPPPVLEPAPIEPVEFGGWYLRGDVGVGISSKPDIRQTFADGPQGQTAAAAKQSVVGFDQQDLSDVAFVGGGAGYQFNNWFRADVTGEYRTSEQLSAVVGYRGCNAGKCGTAKDIYSGSIQNSVFLVNGYVDLGSWWRLTPFIGAGVGGAYTRIDGLYDFGAGSTIGGAAGNGGFGTAASTTKWNLAYAGYAGLAYAVNPNLKVELAYRYLNMGDVKSAPIICTTPCARESQKYTLESQDIKLGMRWLFSDAAPVQPVYYAPPPVYSAPPPLVRKY